MQESCQDVDKESCQDVDKESCQDVDKDSYPHHLKEIFTKESSTMGNKAGSKKTPMDRIKQSQALTSTVTGHITRPALWLLVMMASIGPFGDTEYAPSMPSIAAALGTTYGQVILTMTSYLIGYAISQLFYGPISDRYGRRPVIIAGSLAFIGGSIFCVFSQTLGMLIVGRFIQALGACSGTIMSFAAVRDAFPLDQQARTYARINAAFTIAPAIGPVLGGFVDHYFGWRANFIVLLIMAIILALSVYRFFPETNTRLNQQALIPRHLFKNYLSLFKNRYYPYYLIIIGLCIGVVYNCLTEAPALVIDIMKLSSRAFIIVAGSVMLGFVIGSVICAYLSNKIHAHVIILTGLCLVLCSALVMGTFIYNDYINLATMLIPVNTLFCGIALVLPIASARALSPFGHIAGSASAMLGFFQMGFASASTWALSYFRTGTAYAMPVSFAILSSMAIFVLIAALMWPWRTARP